MEKVTENEILFECMELLEKIGFDAGALSATNSMDSSVLETTLISLRTLNAKFDKAEAISLIKAIMERYNIQIDQLVDERGL